MKSANDNITREPEKPGLYDKKEEVEAYAQESGQGVMKFIEKLFAKAVLKKCAGINDAQVLDFGTGPGWVPILLAKARLDWWVHGLDASNLMLNHANANAKKAGVSIKWILGNAERTGIQSHKFDLIVSHFAFSEFPNGKAAVREMMRLLKPGGMIIMQDLLRPPKWQMPFLIAWRYLTMPFSRMSRQYIESLRGAYTSQELAWIFNEEGLEVSVQTFLKWGGGIGRVKAVKTPSVKKAQTSHVRSRGE